MSAAWRWTRWVLAATVGVIGALVGAYLFGRRQARITAGEQVHMAIEEATRERRLREYQARLTQIYRDHPGPHGDIQRVLRIARLVSQYADVVDEDGRRRPGV